MEAVFPWKKNGNCSEIESFCLCVQYNTWLTQKNRLLLFYEKPPPQLNKKKLETGTKKERVYMAKFVIQQYIEDL